MNYLTTNTELTKIADAIRTKGGASGEIVYPDGFVTGINAISGGGETDNFPPRDTSTDWESESFRGIYLTFDNTIPAGHPMRKFCATLSANNKNESNYTVELGYMDGTVFTVAETCSGWLSGSWISIAIPEYEGYDYAALRIIPDASTNITCFDMQSPYTGAANICDRYGRLPDVHSWHSTGQGDYWGWSNLIRDGVVTGAVDPHAIFRGMSSCVERVPIKFYIPSTGWSSKSAQRAFSDNSSLRAISIDAQNYQFLSMSYMFNGCSSLTTLDLSNWVTTAVTNMSYMFNGCSRLTTLDLSNWVTTAVTNMSDMFKGCSSLTALDLSNFVTSAVTNMSYMFQDCSSLTTLDLSNWVTTAVTNMSYMFQDCSSLTTLDLSNWVTTAVTNMSYMFKGCSSLTTLDLSNWDTSKANLYGMFWNCSSLAAFTSPVWYTSIDFGGCSKLTHGSLMSIINNLATVTSTQKLTIGSTNKAKLTDDEIAIATGKGWTVA